MNEHAGAEGNAGTNEAAGPDDGAAVSAAQAAGPDDGAAVSAAQAAGPDDGAAMGAAQAAAIMREAGQQARRRFRVSHRGAFTGWSAGLLVGYGATWLGVRGQRPFHGQPPAAFAILVLLALAVSFSPVAAARTDSGVGGLSAVRQRIGFVALLAGMAAMFALEGALAHAGASRAVIGVFEASAPVLVAGLYYLTASAVWLDWPVAGLGLWLLVVAAVGGFAGPAGVWGVDALAAGLAFGLMAVFEPGLRRLVHR